MINRLGALLKLLRPSTRCLLLCWLCLPLMAVLTGCQGCSDPFNGDAEAEKQEELEKQKKEKPKPEFDRIGVSILPGTQPTSEPSGSDLDDESESDIDSSLQSPAANLLVVKPGHWQVARYTTTANQSDFSGEFTSTVAGRNMAPIQQPGSQFWITTSRPASLPEKQRKSFEMPFYVFPPEAIDDFASGFSVQLDVRLSSRRSHRKVAQEFVMARTLVASQYQVCVIAQNVSRYGFLQFIPTVNPPLPEIGSSSLEGEYRVVMHSPDESGKLALPDNALALTAIAYLIWDGIDPDSLSSEQQTAVLDWLHWGGQLLISGPKSLDSIRSGFLAPYLPATKGNSRKIDTRELADMNRVWSIEPANSSDIERIRLSSTDEMPIEITPLQPIAPAEPVPLTAGLVVERMVGRGRIVVSAFDIDHPTFVNWRNYDGFINGCLMRRPCRRFGKSSHDLPTVDWNDPSLFFRDPRLNTRLRYFTRDAADPLKAVVETSTSIMKPTDQQPTNVDKVKKASGPSCMPRLLGTVSDPVAGVAGWNDFRSASRVARRQLQASAGVTVPDAKFVARALAAYLICLVPINWLVFRLMRRVEWAWLSAPFIAIAGAIAIVRMAQLDIGFVNSRTEIAVLELQPDYARAHLTRYSGLYTSLSSDYEVTFDDDRAVALPFPVRDLTQDDRPFLASRHEVLFRRDKKVGLFGYPVLSNSTGMIHAEQMIDVAGQIQLTEDSDSHWSIENHSPWRLSGIVVARGTQQGVQLAGAGQLPVGESLALRFDQESSDMAEKLAQGPVVTTVVGQGGDIEFGELYRMAVDAKQFATGDVRLIAWTDQEVGGMNVRPRSTQQVYRTLIIQQLRYGPYSDPEVDVNHPIDFVLEEETP